MLLLMRISYDGTYSIDNKSDIQENSYILNIDEMTQVSRSYGQFVMMAGSCVSSP